MGHMFYLCDLVYLFSKEYTSFYFCSCFIVHSEVRTEKENIENVNFQVTFALGF